MSVPYYKRSDIPLEYRSELTSRERCSLATQLGANHPEDVQKHVCIVLPDFPMAYLYQQAVIASGVTDAVGIMIQSRQDFENMFGAGGMRTTLVALLDHQLPPPNWAVAYATN